MPILYRPDRRPSAGNWLSKGGLMNLYASGEDYLEAILLFDVSNLLTTVENQSPQLNFLGIC